MRKRINADELESKLIAEFEKSLQTAGYFDRLEKELRALDESKRQGQDSEVTRVRRELDQLNARVRAVWDNQGKMDLTNDGLRLVSEELNRLATQKQDLERYLAGMESGVNDPAICPLSLIAQARPSRPPSVGISDARVFVQRVARR